MPEGTQQAPESWERQDQARGAGDDAAMPDTDDAARRTAADYTLDAPAQPAAPADASAPAPWSPPPRPATGAGERDAVRALVAQGALAEGETWYAVSMRWWRSWRDYSGYDKYTSFSSPFYGSAGSMAYVGSEPGPISNDDIAEEEATVGVVNRPAPDDDDDDGDGDNAVACSSKPSTSSAATATPSSAAAEAEQPQQAQQAQAPQQSRYCLRSAMIENSDYEVVHERVWRTLVAWYTGGPEVSGVVTRSTVSYAKNLRVELRPLLVTVYLDSVKGAWFKMRYPKSTKVEQVKKEACEKFGVEAAKTKIWDFHGFEFHKELTDLGQSLENAQIIERNPILIEQQKPDGTWADHARRYNTYPSSGFLSSSSTTTSYNSGYSWGSSYSSTPMEAPGLCGLSNLGNTCFMNSALQCLSNTAPLVNYLLGPNWKNDLNHRNPLGTGGALAQEYQRLVEAIWKGTSGVFSPREFKGKLERFAPQFAGYQQHDSHELLSYLLDGLHEDLNRVRDKPYVEMPDYHGEPDTEWAASSWARHLLRNDSFIVDCFQGQLRSRLVCPQCSYVSVTFDPFMYLSVPLPQATSKPVAAVFHRAEPGRLPVRLNARVPTSGCVRDVCLSVAQAATGAGAPAAGCELVATDVYMSRFYKRFADNEPSDEIDERTGLHVFEVPRASADVVRVTLVLSRTEERSTTTYSYYSSPYSESLFGTPSVLALRPGLTYNELLLEVARRLLPYMDAAALAELARDVREHPELDVAEEAPRHRGADAPSTSTAASSSSSRYMDPDDTPSPSPSPDDAETADAEMRDSTPAAAAAAAAAAPEASEASEAEAEAKRAQEAQESEAAAMAELDAAPEVLAGVRNSELAAALRVAWRAQAGDNYGKDSVVDAFDRSAHGTRALSLRELQSVVVHWSQAHIARLWSKTRENSYDAPAAAAAASEQAEDAGELTLSRCMDLFEQEERLGTDDAWYCPRCKEMRLATKKFDLWRVPGVLVVHLKRFSMKNRYFRDKLDTEVKFPLEGLDLSTRVLCPHDKPLVYDLFAVSNHYGSLGGGHYTAFAKSKDSGKWHRFDDSHVSEVSSPAAEVCTSAAYVLFYQLRDFVPPSPAATPRSPAPEASLSPSPAPAAAPVQRPLSNLPNADSDTEDDTSAWLEDNSKANVGSGGPSTSDNIDI
eukprot:m51a1_g1802 putative ubiquitin carboxyl-terminal hydrolase 15 isoform x2 (1168) ;mRNA; f:447414-451210